MKTIEVSDLLEPCAVKVTRTVLRGGGRSNTLSLPAPFGGAFQIRHKGNYQDQGSGEGACGREISSATSSAALA